MLRDESSAPFSMKPYFTKSLISIFSNASWLIIEKGLRMALGFFVGIWVARYLGPEEFGSLNYALAFVAIFSVFSTLGAFDSMIVRDLVQEPETTNEILGTTFVVKAVGSVVGYVLCLIAVFLTAKQDMGIRWLVIILGTGMMFQIFDVIDYLFQSKLQAKFTVYAKSTAFFITSAGKVICILLRAPLVCFAWLATAEFFLAAIGLLWVYYHFTGAHFFNSIHVQIKRAASLFNQSWPLLLSGISYVVYMKIDQVMLGQMINTHEVGIYSAAARLTEIAYSIPLIIIPSLFPSLINSKKRGKAFYSDRLQKLFDLMAAISIVIALSTTLLSTIIVEKLFGESYLKSSLILAIHIWGMVFIYLKSALGKHLIIEGYYKFIFLTDFIGALVNITANIFLIPRIGGVGAAVATLIGYAVSNHLCCLAYSKTRETGMMMTKSLFVFLRPGFWKGFTEIMENLKNAMSHVRS